MILWQAGLEMISLQPWSGWGIGQSGTQFMHWFQPLNETAQYAGMVKSYLHIGVERGLGILFLWIAAGCIAVCLPLVIAFRSERLTRWVCIATAGSAVVMVFMSANIFNTLWVFPKVWVPVYVALVCIVGGFILGSKDNRKRVLFPTLVSALVLSTACVGGLYITGRILNAGRSEKSKVEDPLIIFSPERQNATQPRSVVFYPEPQVFGEDWGKEVRRLAVAMKQSEVQVISPLSVSGSEFVDGLVPDIEGTWTIITSSVKPLGSKELTERATKIYILHPIERPPVDLNVEEEKLHILLPSLDISGTGGLWRREAKKRGWMITNSGSFSQDIRNLWPDVFVEEIRFQ